MADLNFNRPEILFPCFAQLMTNKKELRVKHEKIQHHYRNFIYAWANGM